MLSKSVLNNLLKVMSHTKPLKRNSALFLNGMKASDTYAFITPHIDFPEEIKNKERIKNELIRRKSNFNLNKLENVWAVYEELKQRKWELEQKKSEIGIEIQKLIRENKDSGDLERLKIQIHLLKDNIKMLKSPLWSAEEVAIVEALKVPNVLHSLTPDKESVILHTHLTRPNTIKNHINIGKELDIINFKKNENYYLQGDAAIFELGAKFYFSSNLKNHNYIQFSNTDFVKSIVIEGCGENHTDPRSTFILHHNEDTKMNVDNRLHLVGAGSLASFFAYHAKNVIHSKALPLKYFAIGRQYKPSTCDKDSLFYVSQASAMQVFSAAKDEAELESVLNELIDVLKRLYVDIGYHFRLRLTPAHELCMWESLRYSVEMYSTSLQQYVEVANISVSGDFISKRLLFTYSENKQSNFLYVLSGTILNVPKLLGCVLEQEEFVVPEKFQVKNWSVSACYE